MTIAAAAFFAVSEGPALAQAMAPYTDGAAGYTIFYPATWERRMVNSVMVSLAPQEGPADTFRENVNVVMENLPAPMTPQQYAMAALNHLQRNMQGYQLMEQGPTTLNGRPGYYIVYRHVMMGRQIQVLAFLTTLGNRAYVITCSADPSQFARYRPFFTQIANTIRFP